MKTSHEANNFPFLFTFFVLPPLQSSPPYSWTHSKHPQSVSFAQRDRTSFTPIQQQQQQQQQNNVIVFCILIFTISENRWVGTTLKLKDTT